MDPRQPEPSAIQHDGKLWIGFLHPDPTTDGIAESLQMTFHQKGIGCGMASIGGFTIQGDAPRAGTAWRTEFRFEGGRTVHLLVHTTDAGTMRGTWRALEGEGAFEFWLEDLTPSPFEIVPLAAQFWQASIERAGPRGLALAATMPMQSTVRMQLVLDDQMLSGTGSGHFGTCQVRGVMLDDDRVTLEVTFRNGIALRLECAPDGDRWRGTCYFGAPGLRRSDDPHPVQFGTCEVWQGRAE